MRLLIGFARYIGYAVPGGGYGGFFSTSLPCAAAGIPRSLVFRPSHLQVGFALFIGPAGDSQVCSDRVGACDHRGCREWSIYCKLWHIRARVRRLTHTRCCGETAFALCAASPRQAHIARHTHTPACTHIGDHFPGPARMHFPLPAAETASPRLKAGCVAGPHPDAFLQATGDSKTVLAPPTVAQRYSLPLPIDRLKHRHREELSGHGGTHQPMG